MKPVVSILLCLLLAFQILLKPGLIGHFYLNQAQIAATLCENKDAPEMKCHGKCYLKKQIEKAEETENRKQAPSRQKDQTEIQSFILEQSKLVILPPSVQTKQDVRKVNLRSGFTSALLRPPVA